MANFITVKKYKSNRLTDYTKLLHKNCPFCESEMLSVVRQNPQIDRCTNCGQAFRQETAKNINADYKDESLTPLWLESTAAARYHYKFIHSIIGFETVSNILEIGPGDGVLIKKIRKKHGNINITVVETNREHCLALSQVSGITVFEDDVENIEFNDKFDLVIMSHVLQQIEKPLQTIEYIYDNLLTDGGFLYIDIPNQDYELQSIDNAAEAQADHLYFFNGANLPDLLARAGFSKNNFMGVKYKTLPRTYGRILSWIAKLEKRNGNKYIVYSLKAFNKLSLFTVQFFRILFDTRPREIPFNKSDSHYNSIAAAVRK